MDGPEMSRWLDWRNDMVILSAHITHKRALMADIERLGREEPSELLCTLSRLPGGGMRRARHLQSCRALHRNR